MTTEYLTKIVFAVGFVAGLYFFAKSVINSERFSRKKNDEAYKRIGLLEKLLDYRSVVNKNLQKEVAEWKLKYRVLEESIRENDG